CCGILFFQAEDGIRDDLVTGVQTCALPILLKTMCRKTVSMDTTTPWISCSCASGLSWAGTKGLELRGVVGVGGSAPAWTNGMIRSEERRVGKEGGWRGGGESGRGRGKAVWV